MLVFISCHLSFRTKQPKKPRETLQFVTAFFFYIEEPRDFWRCVSHVDEYTSSIQNDVILLFFPPLSFSLSFFLSLSLSVFFLFFDYFLFFYLCAFSLFTMDSDLGKNAFFIVVVGPSARFPSEFRLNIIFNRCRLVLCFDYWRVHQKASKEYLGDASAAFREFCRSNGSNYLHFFILSFFSSSNIYVQGVLLFGALNSLRQRRRTARNPARISILR